MKLNEINSDLIMKMGLMNNIVKKQSGDGIEFQIMLQTMLESMGKVEDDKINNKIMTTSVGEKLENLKLVLNFSSGKMSTDIPHLDKRSLGPLIVCFFNAYLLLRERESVHACASGERAEREGDTEYEAGSRLPADNTEPNGGLEPANHDIMT